MAVGAVRVCTPLCSCPLIQPLCSLCSECKAHCQVQDVHARHASRLSWHPLCNPLCTPPKKTHTTHPTPTPHPTNTPPPPHIPPPYILLRHLVMPLQIGTFMSVLESTNSLLTAYANATSYIPDPVYLTGFTSTSPCPSGDSASTAQTSGQSNPGADQARLGYDVGLFSYVGCRCDAEYDNMYAVDGQGGQTLKPKNHRWPTPNAHQTLRQSTTAASRLQ